MPIDTLVLALIVSGFLVFAGALAWTSWHTNRGAPHQDLPNGGTR